MLASFITIAPLGVPHPPKCAIVSYLPNLRCIFHQRYQAVHTGVSSSCAKRLRCMILSSGVTDTEKGTELGAYHDLLAGRSLQKWRSTYDG